MEAIYTLSSFMVVGIFIAGIVGLIRPSLFTKLLRKFATRKYILLGSVALFFAFTGIASATEPAHLKLARQEKQAAEQRAETEAAARVEEQNKVTTDEKTETVAIDFTSETKESNNIPKGETKVTQEGVAGEKTVIYLVSYQNGKEINREVKHETITKQPVTKVTTVGTYETPKTTKPSGGSGYTNSQGNHVPSPSSDPSGATAKCRDGTYSYSQSRRGTCSHHGGVAQWL